MKLQQSAMWRFLCAGKLTMITMSFVGIAYVIVYCVCTLVSINGVLIGTQLVADFPVLRHVAGNHIFMIFLCALCLFMYYLYKLTQMYYIQYDEGIQIKRGSTYHVENVKYGNITACKVEPQNFIEEMCGFANVRISCGCTNVYGYVVILRGLRKDEAALIAYDIFRKMEMKRKRLNELRERENARTNDKREV